MADSLEVLRFVLLGDDRASSAFSSLARQVDTTTRAVDKNNLSLGTSRQKIDLIAQRAQELAKLHPELQVMVRTEAAKASLSALRQDIRGVLNAPVVNNSSGWTNFKANLRDILGSSGGAGGTGGTGLLGITTTLPVVGEVGLPALGGLTVAAAALALALAPVAAALIPITLGFGGLAAIAGPEVSKVFQALTEHGKKLQTTMKSLSPAEKDLVRQAEPLKDQFGQLAKSIQPEIVKAFASGIRILKELMPALKPLIHAAAQALDTFLKKMAEWLNSPSGQAFVHWLATVGPRDIKNFGRIMWDTAHTVGDALHAIYAAGSWIDKFLTHWHEDWIIVYNTFRIIGDELVITALKTVNTIIGVFAKLPGPLGAPFRAAHIAIAGELANINADVHRSSMLIQSAWDSIHGETVPLRFDLSLPTGVHVTTHAPNSHKTGRAAGWRVPGYGGGDSVPALLEPGETVVPKHLTRAVAPLMRAHGVPGFAAGGLVGWDIRDMIRPPAAQFGRTLDATAAADMNAIIAYVRAKATYSGPTPGAPGGGFSGGAPGGGAPAANAALARAMMPAWASGAAWNAWNYVAMAESGWNQFAYNPSGAYGIPQALPFEKMPKAAWPPWAGGSANPAAQIGWMIGYIQSVYGSPQAAAAHEAAFRWYDNGGFLPPGVSVAVNGTGRPERVGGPATVINLTVKVGHGTSPRQAAQEIADILNRGAVAGVRLRKQILSDTG